MSHRTTDQLETQTIEIIDRRRHSIQRTDATDQVTHYDHYWTTQKAVLRIDLRRLAHQMLCKANNSTIGKARAFAGAITIHIDSDEIDPTRTAK